ncbi:MAG: alpha/beta fold hydrolase [Cyanobacteria bacterium J06639_14]
MATAIVDSPHNATPPSGQSWIWQGHRIYYVKAGKSQGNHPPLLLVHGFGASTDHWRKNIRDLMGDFEVWAIDLLGFGRSAKPDLQYSGTVWRDQLQAFIADIIGRPAVIVGNSLGGYASLCLAADYPEAVAGVILLNSAGPFQEDVSVRPVNPLQKLTGQIIRSILLQPLPSWMLFQYVRQRSVIRKTLQKVYLDQTAITDELVEDIRRPADDPGAVKVFASVFKSPRGDTVDVLLNRLSAPLLIIWGEADPWMNARQRSEKFRQHYPSLKEHFLQVGHCPHDEAPQQVNPLIRDWMMDLGV